MELRTCALTGDLRWALYHLYVTQNRHPAEVVRTACAEYLQRYAEAREDLKIYAARTNRQELSVVNDALEELVDRLLPHGWLGENHIAQENTFCAEARAVLDMPDDWNAEAKMHDALAESGPWFRAIEDYDVPLNNLATPCELAPLPEIEATRALKFAHVKDPVARGSIEKFMETGLYYPLSDGPWYRR